MADPLKITDLNTETRQAITQYDLNSGPNGVPDTVLDANDLPAIDAALANPDLSPAARSLVKSVETAATNPLTVPRSQTTAGRIGQAINTMPTYDGMKKLTPDTLKSMTIDERIRAITYIVNKRGYSGLFGWWLGRINNPKEHVILAILNDTPDNQKGELFQKIMSTNLNGRLLRVINGKENRQYRVFARNAVWGLKSPQDVVRGMEQLGVTNDLNGTVDTITSLRQNRGEAFAEQVVSQLMAAGQFESLLGFVYWSPPCYDTTDVATLTLDLQEQRTADLAQLNRFLAIMPRSPSGGEGATAKALRKEFERRHDVNALLPVVLECAIQAQQQQAANNNSYYNNSGDSYASPSDNSFGDSTPPPSDNNFGDSTPPPSDNNFGDSTPPPSDNNLGDSAPPP